METTKSDNLSAPLTGVFQDGGGDLYVLTGLNHNGLSGSLYPMTAPDITGDTLTFSQNAATGDLTVTLNGSSQTFASVGMVYVVTYHGVNSINAAGIGAPMVIYGGDGSDTITGGDGGNTIYGGTAGGNTITAGNGGDTIYGNGGASNTITGGSGDDTIYAGSGGDTINDNLGNNTIYGGVGADTITVGDGNNDIEGGTGNGKDTIVAGNGNNYIVAGTGSGDDKITAGDGSNWLYANNGDDTLTVGSGNDVLYGGSGADILNGGTGYDDLHAGSIDNQLYGNGIHDILDGDLSQIESWGPGLASINMQDKGSLSDAGSYNGNYDSDPGYGGPVADWEFDGITSGQRLGASAIATPMAVYATWDPGASPAGGTQWAENAAYEIFDGTTLVATVPVDQQISPTKDLTQSIYHRFQLLGVYNIHSSEVTVELVDTSYQGGDRLNADAVVVTPLWPTEWIRGPKQQAVHRKRRLAPVVEAYRLARRR